jgi:hypothetical protein
MAAQGALLLSVLDQLTLCCARVRAIPLMRPWRIDVSLQLVRR